MVVYILYTFRPLSKRVVDVILCVSQCDQRSALTQYTHYTGISDYTVHCEWRTHCGSEHKECFGTAQTLHGFRVAR